MDEKTLVVGKPSQKTKILMLLIGIVCLVLFFVCFEANIAGCKMYSHTAYAPGGKTYVKTNEMTVLNCLFFANRLNNVFCCLIDAFLWVGVIFTIVGLIVYCSMKDIEITVTDKRVYGCGMWGKRVDIPVDSVSAVGTSMMKGIDVSSSSGSIKFKAIMNYKDVHKEISSLLINRQQPSESVKTESSSVDDLLKLKELLDAGLISQEEFDKKKHDVLGL